jgi:hypothetical protein
MKHFVIQNKKNNARFENDFCVHLLFLSEDDPAGIQTCRRTIGTCNDEDKLMFVTFIE